MDSLLGNWISQIESWESAAEFEIPREEWANYNVIQRKDDVYIASLSSIFDVLREHDLKLRQAQLWSLAKALLVYSRGALTDFISGVGRDLNQLYAAALFYIAGYPATGTFLARQLNKIDKEIEEEGFLHSFLNRDSSDSNIFSRELAAFIVGQKENLSGLKDLLNNSVNIGLFSNPRQFIAAKLGVKCIERFSEVNIWKLLREHTVDYSTDVWRAYFEAGQANMMWELLPSQQEALSRGLLNQIDKTVSLQMPTSAGKTAVCELLIYNEVKIHERAVLFFAPFRALAAEIQRGISYRLSGMGIRIIATHGGNIPSRSESVSAKDAEVLIVTPEKFVALEQILGISVDRFKTIICDEGHLIDDESRGLGYELLLSRLRSAKVSDRRFVFLSAVIPNIENIHAWLGGDKDTVAKSEYRPVDTDYCFVRPESRNEYRLDINPTAPDQRRYYLRRFLVQDDFRFTNTTSGRPKLINGSRSFISLAFASALKAMRTGPVAIFTTSRGKQGASEIGKTLLEMLNKGVRAALQQPARMPEQNGLLEFLSFQLGQEHLLYKLVIRGIGFHHGRLPQEIRREIEAGVQQGSIRIIICTNTLTEGVNLPIRSMIIHTVRRYDPSSKKSRYLQNRDLKNIIGRAGRAGKETRGRIIFVNWHERFYIEQVLRDQNIEPATGILFKLVEKLLEFSRSTNKTLSNELFECQKPSFLSLIDKIDYSLLGLMSSDTLGTDLEQQVIELLERTLAYRLSSSVDLQNCLKTVFLLRAEYLESKVEHAMWPKLKKSGAVPRFWNFVSEKALTQNPLWALLQDPLDECWLNEVIVPLLEYPPTEISCDRSLLIDIVKGWISGLTYWEMAKIYKCEVDIILDIVCYEMGFILQDLVSKLCQISIETHEEGNLSEVARSWPSFLQFGLGSLQQLDLYEQGLSDRLAAWGVSRYLTAAKSKLRGKNLVLLLKRNRVELKSYLEQEGRIPAISLQRLIDELRLGKINNNR